MCTVEDTCVCAGAVRVGTCGRVCIGAPFSLDAAFEFEFVPLALVFERRGEDDLNPLFVGVLGGGRTVADLGVAGGIEVVVFELELELELEDQVPARVSDVVVRFVEEEEEVGCAVEEGACVVEEEEIFILEDTDPEATPVTHEDGFVRRTQHSNTSCVVLRFQ